MKLTQENAGRIGALVYTGGSLAAALIFFTAAAAGGYGWVARLGGAAWVFALAMIILMPTVTPFLRERAGQPVERAGHEHR